MKITYFNDTKKDIKIHPATNVSIVGDKRVVETSNVVEFECEESSNFFIKSWDGMLLIQKERNDK